MNFQKCLLALVLIASPAILSAEDSLDGAMSSVVKINTTFFEFSYETPWKQPSLSAAGGTGFIIEGNRILTNAHVVSLANTIRVQRPDQRKDYQARVLFIAHDSDLAMITVDDPEFFKGSRPLDIGQTPELNSPVHVIGFPIGGDRVSITRGIVSRKDMDLYSHSEVDYHLIIQVDAAINPGNSGGPGMQNGKVIGIAFQSYTRGENLGYLIPPPVILRFLDDIKDGRYDGYIDFGTLEIGTVNPTLRRAIGLDGDSADTGVLVYSVLPGSSAENFVKPGDVLVSINGKAITDTGDVEIDGHMMSYAELIDNLPSGASIQVEVIRGREKLALTFPARKTSIFGFQRKNYETPPAYYLCGGLVFQPLDADLFEAMSTAWGRDGRTEILFRYKYFIHARIYEESRTDVILTRRLADPINLYSQRFVSGIVESVNGEKVRDFSEFVDLMDRFRGERFIIVRFRNQSVPLVLRSSDLEASNRRVMQSYGIANDRRVVRH